MGRTADQYRIIAAGAGVPAARNVRGGVAAGVPAARNVRGGVAAGWIERADRGRLRFEGRDAAAFLQGLVTNDVRALAEGGGVYAAYLTPHGRMLTDLRIHHCGASLLAQVPAAMASALAVKFDQLIFTEDVRVTDVSASIAQISVMGAGAAELVARAFASPAETDRIEALPRLAHLDLGVVRVARGDDIELPIFDLFLDPDKRDASVRRLEALGAAAIPFELLEALRIEAGRPAYGIDMTEETIPLEAGLLERGISTTKGCYVGQEIIIRVLHRGGGRVAKRLVMLRVDAGGAAPPPAATPLMQEGQSVGRITSAAESPASGRIVALGSVAREHAEVGRRLSLPAEAGGYSAEIVGFAG